MITSPNLSRADLSTNSDSPGRWFPTMAAERRRLEEDEQALRDRERNLQEYEARLRALQAEIENARPASSREPATRTSVTPSIFHRETAEVRSQDDSALQAAWEKLYRTREILEAEQAHVRDDRLALREHEIALRRREEAVAVRERQLAEREDMATSVTPAARTIEAPGSSLGSLSRAPFDFARRILGGR